MASAIQNQRPQAYGLLDMDEYSTRNYAKEQSNHRHGIHFVSSPSMKKGTIPHGTRTLTPKRGHFISSDIITKTIYTHSEKIVFHEVSVVDGQS